jgi:hypothetical protein
MFSKYKWYFIIGLILVAAVIYYLNRSVAAVNHTVRNFNEAYFASLPQKEADTINRSAIPGYISKLRKKAYLKAQVTMAASDSAGLIINMRDSSIMLQIKGVNVRKIKIRESIVSSFFHRANPEAVYNMLSNPLIVTGMNASVSKDPLQVHVAPKDTIEALQNAIIQPDTTYFEAVYFTLETNQNIKFFIAQSEDTIASDRRAHFYFDLNDRLDHAKSDLKAITSFKMPEYTPFIKIWIPKSEAKIIFYAIPREGMITLTL